MTKNPPLKDIFVVPDRLSSSRDTVSRKSRYSITGMGSQDGDY